MVLCSQSLTILQLPLLLFTTFTPATRQDPFALIMSWIHNDVQRRNGPLAQLLCWKQVGGVKGEDQENFILFHVWEEGEQEQNYVVETEELKVGYSVFTGGSVTG